MIHSDWRSIQNSLPLAPLYDCNSMYLSSCSWDKALWMLSILMFIILAARNLNFRSTGVDIEEALHVLELVFSDACCVSLNEQWIAYSLSDWRIMQLCHLMVKFHNGWTQLSLVTGCFALGRIQRFLLIQLKAKHHRLEVLTTRVTVCICHAELKSGYLVIYQGTKCPGVNGQRGKTSINPQFDNFF